AAATGPSHFRDEETSRCLINAGRDGDDSENSEEMVSPYFLHRVVKSSEITL
ncbi:hypothetical protein K0M31_018570, partial [Melipona bicolor]